MNPILPALLVAIAVLITGVWVARARARIRSYYAGRRDHLAGQVDPGRLYLDRPYFEGVLAERIADTRKDSPR